MLCTFQIISLRLNAQNELRCGTMEHHQWMTKNNPDYARSFPDNEKVIQQRIAHSNSMRSSMLPDTIPIVVHVVYGTAAQNISDAQIQSQIDALNEDFARENADTVNTPAVWQPIAGTMPYRFTLARQDPSGAPTNGIVRMATFLNSFTTNNDVKFDTLGGSDAWDVNTYLNIWVCNLANNMNGYGEFPTGVHTNTYGFVADFTAFGRIGTALGPYDLGRTTTHELGHCFNLFHIWGNDNGGCAGTDQVSDTPNQDLYTLNCAAFPHTDACSPNAPGIMFMNYMDFTEDVCMNMFTQGQATRMVAAVTGFYPTIVNSIGLVAGIKDKTLENEVVVFPNPTKDKFNFRIANSTFGNFDVVVTDMMGSIILYNDNWIHTGDKIIDLSGRPAGVYFLNVKNENTNSIKRLVLTY